MKTRLFLVLVLVVLVFALPDRNLWAEGDARDYVAAPAGTKLMAIYYNFQTGNKLYADGEKITDDFNLSANIGILRPVMFVNLGPIVADPQALIPFGSLSVDGSAVGGTEIQSTGLADVIITATFWLINKPEKKWWLGFTPYFFLPVGEYDNKRPINLGENRWKFREEFATVIGLAEKWYLDLYAAGEFYLDNDDYGPESVRLEQNPAGFLEAHLSYDFTKSFYVAMEYFYKFGGATTIAGADQDNGANNHAGRVTFGFWITDSVQLLLKYRRDFDIENGPKTQSFETRLFYLF